LAIEGFSCPAGGALCSDFGSDGGMFGSDFGSGGGGGTSPVEFDGLEFEPEDGNPGAFASFS
jgi:hypothetical protein